MIDAEAVADRVERLRERIDAVQRSWTHRVAVVGVTKGFADDAVEAAVAGGCDAIGENYAQELLDKRATVERLGPEVHFIGRLQRNKVRQLVGLVDVWCSLDRASVIDEIAKRAAGARVLIQVDTSRDPGKGGCDVGEVAALVERATNCGLIVRGLMTVGPTGGDSEAARPGISRGALARRPTRPRCVLDGDDGGSPRRRRGGQHRGSRRHRPVRGTTARSAPPT